MAHKIRSNGKKIKLVTQVQAKFHEHRHQQVISDFHPRQSKSQKVGSAKYCKELK